MKLHSVWNWKCLIAVLIATSMGGLMPLGTNSRIALGADESGVANSSSSIKTNSNDSKPAVSNTAKTSGTDAEVPSQSESPKRVIKRLNQPLNPLPVKQDDVSTEGDEVVPGAPLVVKKSEPVKGTVSQEKPTHEQTGSIVIGKNGDSPCTLNTFCLTPDGKIVAAVQCQSNAATSSNPSVGANPEKKLGELRLFDGNGQALDVWPLAINPTAVNVGPDSAIYVAGSGKVLKLDPQGKVLLSIDAPNTSELAENRAAIIKELDEQTAVVARPKEVYVRAIEQTKKRVAELEEKEAAAKKDGKELSRSEKVRLTSARRSVDSLEQALIKVEELAVNEEEEKRSGQPKKVDQAKEARIQAALEYKKRISGIAVTDKDVFVACSSAIGWGYDVWQLDLELGHGKKVVQQLRGCCGQMDIQARGDHLVVAENSMHRVTCYDRTGKLIKNIGERESVSKLGFEGCCNPMNCRLGSGGEIYTSESSIGRIRKYSPDGTYLGLVAKASLVSGCKHVAVAVSTDGRKVYLLDVTKGEILIMGEKTPVKTAAK